MQRNWLVGDLGATSCRLGLCEPVDGQLSAVEIFRNDDFDNLAEMLANYLDALPIKELNCALAVAAPIDGDKVVMCNRNWTFSAAELARQFEFSQLEVFNDFYAIARCLPLLGDKDRLEIGRASAYRSGNLAVVGPGSGLGMSAWIQDASNGVVMSGEGGHITVAARNAREEEIVRHFRERFGHCSAERILSGPGLVALHFAMHGQQLASSELITANVDDPQCAQTLQQFFRFLGSTAAELALITGAYGGVYIAGGIVPANIEQLLRSEFRQRFEDKNRYRDYMRAIPTWVITAEQPGLLGLCAHIKRL